MQRIMTISLTFDDDSGAVTEMDMTEGLYNRTEVFIQEGKPISIHDALRYIGEELKSYL